jgi:hypothetical protein
VEVSRLSGNECLGSSIEPVHSREIGELNLVTNEDDYRMKAAETLDLANRASTSADKGRLVALAEKWLDLADRAHRRHAGLVASVRCTR